MPLFSKRSSMLEVQNRALIKTAKERAEQIEKLERELQILRERAEQTDKSDRKLQTLRETVEHQTDKLRGELQTFREGVEQASKLELELQQARSEIERLTLERDFYSKRTLSLEEENRALTHRVRLLDEIDPRV
jgi:chromosome segregation ATPase